MISESWIIASASLVYANPIIVVQTSLLIMGSIFAISLYAFLTRWDFNMTGTGSFVLMFILSISGLFYFRYGYSKDLIIMAVGVLFFSCLIIYDTQRIINSKHKFLNIGAENYVLAAVSLQMDLIFVFLFIIDLLDMCGD